MAPVFALPNGKASSQALAGLSYQSFRCVGRIVLCDLTKETVIEKMKQKIMKKTIDYFRLKIFEFSSQKFSIKPIAASFCIVACTNVVTAPEVNNFDKARILSMFASPGWHSVSQLMELNDRAICVLGQAGAYSKIDRHGYLPDIEKLKLPWVHGFLAEIGVTTDWYWTLVIFDSSKIHLGWYRAPG